MVWLFKICLVGMMLVLPVAAYADNALDGKVAVSEEAINDAQKLYDDMQAILEDLTEANQRHFLAVYQTYALIGTVQTVRGDVGKAVIACGEDNPDLKDKMATRFEAWKDAVNPVILEAKALVDNMVIAQDYRKPKQMWEFLDQIDQVRIKTDSSLNKVPVTNEKSCNKLYDTMDDTQDGLVGMLQETLVAIPRALSSNAAAEEAVKETEDSEGKAEADEDEASAQDDQ